MNAPLQIVDWSAKFETAKTRKLQRLLWFHSPTGCDSRGYRKLARLGADGFLALGVFQALCQAMATLRMDARKSGAFLNSDGSAMAMADVWEISRIPAEVGTLALPILQASGWIVAPGTDGGQVADHQSATGLPPASLQEEETGGEIGEESEAEEEGSGEPPPAATPAADPPENDHATALVEACPRPSFTMPTLQAARRCLERHAGSLHFDDIRAQVRIVTAQIRAEWTDSEKLQFIPNAERFFEEDLWRRHPDEWRGKARPRNHRPPVETGGRTFEVLDLRKPKTNATT